MKKIALITSLCIIFQYNASQFVPQALIDLKNTTRDHFIGPLEIRGQLNSVFKGALFNVMHQIAFKKWGTGIADMPFFALFAFECADTIKHFESSCLLAKIVGHSFVYLYLKYRNEKIA
jgi:hypothetical protein